jgi:hypothetical protein
MKVIKDEIATLKRRRRVTVELDHDEQLMAFKDGSYYRLAGQLDDVVGGYCLTWCSRVTWCSIEQKWVDA